TDPSKPYGDVSYADPGYQSDGQKRYPLDSEEHCRAAWSYINQAGNAAKYSPAQLKSIKARIMAAGKKYGITFADQQRDVDEGEYRGHSHPGQHYKHGWIPVGGGGLSKVPAAPNGEDWATMHPQTVREQLLGLDTT